MHSLAMPLPFIFLFLAPVMQQMRDRRSPEHNIQIFFLLAQKRKLQNPFNSRNIFSIMLSICYVAEQADLKPKGGLEVYRVPQNFRENLPSSLQASSLHFSTAGFHDNQGNVQFSFTNTSQSPLGLKSPQPLKPALFHPTSLLHLLPLIFLNL